MKTPGQEAYEQELKIRPRYEDGSKRKTWKQLTLLEQWTWEKNPTARMESVK